MKTKSAHIKNLHQGVSIPPFRDFKVSTLRLTNYFFLPPSDHAKVRLLRKDFSQRQVPERARQDPHDGEVAGLQVLRQGVPVRARPRAAHQGAHGRETVPVSVAVVHCIVKILPLLNAARCEECPSRFSSSSRLSEHRTIHTGRTPHSCPSCGAAFRLWTTMKKHSARCGGSSATLAGTPTAAAAGPEKGEGVRLQYVIP